MIECKATRTVQPAMAEPLVRLARAMRRPPARLLVVHRASATTPPTQVVAPGVRALEVRGFAEWLNRGGPARAEPAPARFRSGVEQKHDDHEGQQGQELDECEAEEREDPDRVAAAGVAGDPGAGCPQSLALRVAAA